MLDIKRIKEDPEKVKAGLRAKEVNCDQEVDRILALDKERRDIIFATEQMKAEQNKVSKTIPQLKKAGEDTAPVFQRMGELKSQIAANDETLRTVEAEYRTLMLSLPNLPDEDLKPGGKENNEPLRYFGEPHKFDFPPKHHVDLCTDLGFIDYTVIWRYFSWTNQTLAMIVLWAASMYLYYEKKNYWITAVPATFMSAVSATYFLLGNECLGQFINHKTAEGVTVYNTAVAYPIGIAVAVLFLGIFLYTIKKRHTQPHYETLGK